MAAIALTTAGRVEVIESHDQKTQLCAVAVIAGQPVYTDATGKWALANATDAAHSSGVHIATKSAAKGEALTAIRTGKMDGWNVSGMAYNASVFLSDTDGTLATTAGTVSTVLGRVQASTATPVGTAPDKTIRFACPV